MFSCSHVLIVHVEEHTCARMFCMHAMCACVPNCLGGYVLSHMAKMLLIAGISFAPCERGLIQAPFPT